MNSFLPVLFLVWGTTLEALPDGNIVIGNCHAGEGQPQLIEVDPQGKVVWSYHNWEHFGNSLSNSLLLDAPRALR